MLTFSWYFWPVIWATIGAGAVATIALCVAVANMPAPHLNRHATANPRYARRGPRAHRHAHA